MHIMQIILFFSKISLLTPSSSFKTSLSDQSILPHVKSLLIEKEAVQETVNRTLVSLGKQFLENVPLFDQQEQFGRMIRLLRD